MLKGGNPGLYIGAAIQKVKMEVDEEGAKAAAASAVMMMEKCLRMQKPIAEVRCDRTFCGYIRIGEHVLFRYIYDGSEN